MNLQDYLISINETKENIIRNSEVSEHTAKKLYPPFVINRCLTFHKECVELCQELNKLNISDNLQHYEFLLHTIPKKKRYGVKWGKTDEVTEIMEVLQKIYGYSLGKARFASSLLSPEQVEYYVSLINNKGGKI